MTQPTFDADGYPTEETLDALRDWPTADPVGALDFLKAAWVTAYGSVAHDISAHEAAVLLAGREDRFLRLATGGWSGNESLLGTFRESFIGYLTWRLSAAGGLHIFRYPKP